MAESRDLHRGDVWDADLPDDIGRHHAVLLSRDVAMARRHRAVVVLVTSNVLGKRTEVAVGPEEGLDYDCVIDADDHSYQGHDVNYEHHRSRHFDHHWSAA